MTINFQNEWIVAWRDGEPLAMSPDLICVLDSVSGEAVGSETIRYGQRVTVIALPPPPVFLSPRGLEHVGPRAFGYDLDFRSVFRRMRRIGIDVGGTNTDAVLIEDGKVVRAVKAPTSEDVTTGILDSLEEPRLDRRARDRPQAHRRRDDRHHAFHQCRGPAPASHQGRGAQARHAGLGLAAAVLRLAGGSRRRWCAAACGWSKAATNMTAGRSCRSTRRRSPRPRRR